MDTFIELARNGFPPAAAASDNFIDQAMNETGLMISPVSVRTMREDLEQQTPRPAPLSVNRPATH